MGVIGPLGSDAAPIGKRLVYWLSLMLTGTLFANVVTRWAVRIELFERRPWVWAALVALAITPPLTVVVWLASGVTFGLPLHWSNVIDTGPVVLLISLAMLALTVLSQRTPTQTHAAATGAPPTPFLARLSPKLRGADIHAVQAEDHYLRLHTSGGQDLILMRLADARRRAGGPGRRPGPSVVVGGEGGGGRGENGGRSRDADPEERRGGARQPYLRPRAP